MDFCRTHHCGALRLSDKGSSATLAGWVDRWRNHGGVLFVDLRDRYGITQLVFKPDANSSAAFSAEIEKLRAEWVIVAKGTVMQRAEGMVNSKLTTGEIELLVEEWQLLSKAKTPPFSICEPIAEANEELRLHYRYLDIRRGEIAKKLAVRHRAMMATRQYMDEQGFLEISTPLLGKSTPEGARDYLVPSRLYPGAFYALPQSPQLFKQLLMVAGMDRYFQIAPCFRDEDLRADRQPEFTQIDIEMSFATPQQLFPLIEGLVKFIFKKCGNIDINVPFRQLSHQSCIDRYGTDKPDMRFGMELAFLEDIAAQSSFALFRDILSEGGTVKGFCVKGGADLSRKELDDYTIWIGRLGAKGLAWMKRQNGLFTSNIAKFFDAIQQQQLIQRLQVADGDLLFIIADSPARANQALDHLRRRIARDRKLIESQRYEFLWVTDFPLFSWNGEERRLESEHHPFTSPHFDDIPLLDTAPLSVRSSSYDLVLNGYEIASGSQRIHNSDLQQKIFEVLKLTPEELQAKFGFFIEALSYGTPPHLGIALGFDRLIMILTQTENIRDVIAFPKTQKASDLMMQSPSTISQNQLDELHLQIQHPKWS